MLFRGAWVRSTPPRPAPTIPSPSSGRQLESPSWIVPGQRARRCAAPTSPVQGPRAGVWNCCSRALAWRLGGFRQKGESTCSRPVLAGNTSLMSFELTRESLGELFLSLSFLSFTEKHTYHIHTQMHIPHAHPFKNSSFSYVTRLICVISLFATGCLKRFSVWVTQIWRQFLFGPLVSQLLPEWREDPEGVPRGSRFSLSVVRGESEEHGHDRVCSPPPVCCRIWK